MPRRCQRQGGVASAPCGPCHWPRKPRDGRALRGHQAFDGVADGRAPPAAAVFTFGKNADADLALQLERLEHRRVLGRPQLFDSDAVSRNSSRASKKLRAVGQTADVVGSKGWGHGIGRMINRRGSCFQATGSNRVPMSVVPSHLYLVPRWLRSRCHRDPGIMTFDLADRCSPGVRDRPRAIVRGTVRGPRTRPSPRPCGTCRRG